jgi:hypothetical protein
MKKWGLASLVAVALLGAAVLPSEAGGRGHWRGGHWHGGPRVFVGLGVGAPYWWYGYPYWYYPPAYYYGPPRVVVEQPPVYVEQTPPPATSAPPEPTQYWYYCEPSGAYYPSVQTCAEAWVKVPARPQP